ERDGTPRIDSRARQAEVRPRTDVRMTVPFPPSTAAREGGWHRTPWLVRWRSRRRVGASAGVLAVRRFRGRVEGTYTVAASPRKGQLASGASGTNYNALVGFTIARYSRILRRVHWKR